MNSKRVPTKRPLATDIVGLPARQLADMLDDILAEQKGESPPSGLFGMAEMLRVGLLLPAGEAYDEPRSDEGGEDLLPELRTVQTLLAHIPRAPYTDDKPAITLDHAPSAFTGGEMQALPDPSTLTGYDLDAIRQALRAFAGEHVPDAVFDEVEDIAAELSGKPKPAREIVPPAPAVPQPTAASLAPPAGAPPEPAPEPATPQPMAAQRPVKVKAKPARQRTAALPSAAEEMAPPAMPAPTFPEPVAEVRPLKVKIKPARQPKAAPAQRAEVPVQPEADVPPADEDDVLLLTDDLVIPATEVPAFDEAAIAMDDAGYATAAQAEVIAEPVSPPAASPVDAPEAVPGADAGALAARGDVIALVEAIIAAHRPVDTPGGIGRGENTLPDRVEVLESLLADPPPANDFIALDLLAECWGKGTQTIPSRALLAVAQNLSRNFGLPGKMPMASSKAWKMLDPEIFQEELAHRLIAIGDFISDWQRTQRTFLILEFGEIELIEHLFEALRPADHLDLLANVMNFKVLSNRRMGLIRRVPNRVRKQIQPMLPERAEEALVLLAHTKALLERLAEPTGFGPIIDAATKALEEIEKLMKQAAAAAAPPLLPGPPGAGGGMALGRIGA